MPSQPQTFFEKVWNEHIIADLGEDTYLLQIDRLFLHELSGAVAMEQLEASGREPASPATVAASAVAGSIADVRRLVG
jgi:3-isopropylmalate/(R)-2-methylmalate dehydratase large subunit